MFMQTVTKTTTKTTGALYLRDLSFMRRKLEPWPDTAAIRWSKKALHEPAACTWTNDDSAASLHSLLPQAAAAKIHGFNGFFLLHAITSDALYLS